VIADQHNITPVKEYSRTRSLLSKKKLILLCARELCININLPTTRQPGNRQSSRHQICHVSRILWNQL